MLKGLSYIRKQNTAHPSEISPFVISDLEQTIDPHNFLHGRTDCNCDICFQKTGIKKQKIDSNIFRASSSQSATWLRKILDGLCISGAKTLRIFLPDIIFVGQTLEIYQTNRKDGRMIKLTAAVPLKSLYPTMVRLRREYKTLLQENFNEKMLNTIDRSFMHIKYFDKFVPSHFHDGTNNSALLENKFQFKRYILHKNKKYEIQQLQQHKMNDKQPFCLVKYKDGNCQLFNQIQFQLFSLGNPLKLQEEIVFVQSYIKYKLQTQAIYFSEYTLGQNQNEEFETKAEREVTLLIGGLNKYDQGYTDIEHVEQADMDMMITKPKQYVELMTLKMVHYLGMTCNIYIEHIKLKWIINDIGTVYLQEILELQISEIPNRLIRFRLPPKDEPVEYFHDAHHFGDMYKEMRKRKAASTNIIKKQLEGKSYQEMLSMMDPECDLKNISLHAVNKEKQGFNIHHHRQTRNKKKQCHIQKKNQETKTSNRYNKPDSQFKRVNLREQSLKLDSWRNIGYSVEKQKTYSKISNYFTVNSVIKGKSYDKREIRTQGRLRKSIAGQCQASLETHTPSIFHNLKMNPSLTTKQSSNLPQRIKKRLSFTIE